MKDFINIFLFSIIFTIIFFANEYKIDIYALNNPTKQTECKEKNIENKEVNISIKTNVRLNNIYLYEYMYAFLYNDFIKKTTYDKAFNKYLKKIKNVKTETLTSIEDLFEKEKIMYEKPETLKTGEIDFKNEKVNKLKKILGKVNNKRKMYKYICITLNSTIYKLSEEINNTSNKSEYQSIIDNNIEMLLSVDKTIGKIRMGNCCKLAKVLCKKEKPISYKKLNKYIFPKQCIEKELPSDNLFLKIINDKKINDFINNEYKKYENFIHFLINNK